MRNYIVYIVITFFTMFTVSAVNAQAWRDGEAKFDLSKRKVSSANVVIHTVDDVWQTCERESKKRGLGGFGYSVDACTFWEYSPLGNTCTIFFSKKVSMHEMGHEMRHCFVGTFH